MLSRRRCCCNPTCNQVFHVTGCNALGLEGATVGVWTDSSKTTLVATGTTDASGNLTLDLGSAGTYYREVSASRFATASGNFTATCTGGTVSDALSPASGYHCYTGCSIPLPDTLHFSDSALGTSGTATWFAPLSRWLGSDSFSTFGCGGCPAGTAVTVGYALETTGVITVSWQVDGSGCPVASGTPTSIHNIAGLATTCPMSFSAAWSFTDAGKLYCSNPAVVTFTE